MRPRPCYSAGLCTQAALPLLLLLLLTSWSKVQGDCGRPPPVPFATLRSGSPADSYPVRTELTYRCLPGYELIRGKAPVLRCLDDSSWSEENPQFCQGRRCPAPAIENGGIRTEGDLRFGSEITYVCDHGYQRIGGANARCILTMDNQVTWSTSPPRCERIQCFPPPEVENGRHSGEDRPVFGYGDAVTYKCSKDYTLIGPTTISCMVSADSSRGEWSPSAPQCKVVSCPRPEISNGRLTTTFQATYGYEHTIGFECNRGFTLVGSSTATCGADSNWHPPVPTCVRGVVTTLAPTVRPDGESNNSIAIAVGTVIAVLLGVGLIAAVWIFRNKLKNGKTEPPSQPSESYRALSRNPDIVLESTDSHVA